MIFGISTKWVAASTFNGKLKRFDEPDYALSFVAKKLGYKFKAYSSDDDESIRARKKAGIDLGD